MPRLPLLAALAAARTAPDDWWDRVEALLGFTSLPSPATAEAAAWAVEESKWLLANWPAPAARTATPDCGFRAVKIKVCTRCRAFHF